MRATGQLGQVAVALMAGDAILAGTSTILEEIALVFSVEAPCDQDW